MENTTQKYTLQQLADMIADCKNSMKPLLSKDDMDAVKSIMISASGLMRRHEFTQSKERFSKDHPKVLSDAQAKKLLTSKKTDLIKGFIGKSGKPFDAFLVLQPDGKVGFEFPPRNR
jgi:hypothetical protein